jgi:hypothetical protein
MAQAKAKSNSVVTTQWSGDILTIDVLGAAALMFDRTLASPANRDMAEKHGWTQRLCDRAAKGRDPKTGKPAPASAKYNAIEELLKYYEGGDVPWKMSGGGHAEGGLLLEALVELRAGQRTEDQIRSFLDTRTAQQLATVRKIPELIVIMNRLRMERAGSVDMSEALGDLDSMDAEEELNGDDLDDAIAKELNQ